MKNTPERALKDQIAEEAILWMVRLQSGEVSPAEHQAFKAWRSRDSRHADAFKRLQSGLDTAQASPWRGRPSAPVLHAINAPSGRRSFMCNSLAFGALAVSLGVLGRAAYWPSANDLETGTAERRNWQLADGSRLQLNARSCVSTAFVDNPRQLQLHQGELVLDVARNPQVPFVLRTAQGTLRCNGGRLMVRQTPDATRLATLDGSLRLIPERGAVAMIEPRRSVVFDHTRIVQQQPLLRGEAAWLDGWLEARNQPLADVIETIRAYRRGIVRLDSSLDNLTVSGLYPLDNSDQSLEMLEQQLPIRVRRFNSYWINIERA